MNLTPKEVHEWMTTKIVEQGWKAEEIAKILNIDIDKVEEQALESLTRIAQNIAVQGVEEVIEGKAKKPGDAIIERLVNAIGLTYMGGFTEGWISRSGELPHLPDKPPTEEAS